MHDTPLALALLLARTLCALAVLLAGAAVHAGRPLATDDAGTAEAGRCQVEAWIDRADDRRERVAAAACGLADGVELGIDVARPSPRDDVRLGAGAALKWAPQAWRLDTAAGAVRLGLKAAVSSERTRAGGWGEAHPALFGLASAEPRDGVALHANLGVLRDRASRTTGALMALAATWAPIEPLLLFAEAQASDERAVFGPPVRSAGARWWLVPERLGIDLVGSRAAGVPGTTWSIGFGWYGIGG